MHDPKWSYGSRVKYICLSAFHIGLKLGQIGSNSPTPSRSLTPRPVDNDHTIREYIDTNLSDQYTLYRFCIGTDTQSYVYLYDSITILLTGIVEQFTGSTWS